MELKGKTVAVVGLARSGVAAAKLCRKLGATVIAQDAAPASALVETIASLQEVVSEIEIGRNSFEFLEKADLVVVSPGVPLALPVLQQLKTKGTPVIAEVELAFYAIDCPILGITGSNGKTTTTTLAGQMLEASGRRVFVGGNIGTALSELPLSGKIVDVALVELSSFQLEAIDKFTVAGAALLNITEDHMDRYPSFDAYADAKMGLLHAVEKQGVAICNATDPQTARRCENLPVQTMWFAKPEGPGAWINGNDLHVKDTYGQTQFTLANFDLVGRHNHENAMAAVLLARCGGATDAGIQTALDLAKALPHRIEPVRTVNGVRIFNDSKATSPSSVKTALAAFDAPVVLLMGGRDKGSDFTVLADRAKAVFTFGESGEEIAEQVNGEYVGTMAEAAGKAFTVCNSGDVLLLCPGCASFDAFKDYMDRGDSFKEWAGGL
jgi:UDP-N-acetylmuramoylalanine--D-glutamate ligase